MTLRPGAAVILHSLSARADLNGASGVLRKYDEEKGRWNVAVDGQAKKLALKAENLRAVAHPAEALPAVTTQDLLGFEDHEAELKKGGAPPAADASSAKPLSSSKTPNTYLRDVYGSTPKGQSAPEPATYEPLGDGAGEEDPLAAPLARGCRVEVRYAGTDDVWYPGHVAGVGVYGLYDVEAPAAPPPSKMSLRASAAAKARVLDASRCHARVAAAARALPTFFSPS